jgi:nucleotide-binding universal stress UspA family protein
MVQDARRRDVQAAELVMEHSSSSMRERASPPDGIKTILFHVCSDEHLDDRLQIVLSLARAFGAHLHLLHVMPTEAYTVTDTFSVFISPQVLKALEDEAAALREKLQRQLETEDVSWDYEEVSGEMLPHLVQRAALADLVLTGRQPQEREFGGPPTAFLGDMLTHIRSPLLVLGDGVTAIDPFGAAIVTWNGSYEAANALRAAVPLLKVASRVRLVRINEPNQQQMPPTAALAYLSRHGVHAELFERERLGDTVAQEIVDQAAADGAGYIVMGAYGHSRAGGFLFGGVTRSLLKKCPFCLIMAH